MKLKELLDVTDENRKTDPDNSHSIIKIMDDNGKAEATFRASSHILDLIENREIESMSASSKDTYEIWLEEG